MALKEKEVLAKRVRSCFSRRWEFDRDLSSVVDDPAESVDCVVVRERR